MPTTVKQLMEAANAAVPKITPDKARDLIAKGNTLIVDVRDAPEVEKNGKVAGAVNVSRGMLEFRADPESPYHDKNFSKDRAVILYCASGGGGAGGVLGKGAKGKGLKGGLKPGRLQRRGGGGGRGRKALSRPAVKNRMLPSLSRVPQLLCRASLRSFGG